MIQLQLDYYHIVCDIQMSKTIWSTIKVLLPFTTISQTVPLWDAEGFVLIHNSLHDKISTTNKQWRNYQIISGAKLLWACGMLTYVRRHAFSLQNAVTANNFMFIAKVFITLSHAVYIPLSFSNPPVLVFWAHTVLSVLCHSKYSTHMMWIWAS